MYNLCAVIGSQAASLLLSNSSQQSTVAREHVSLVLKVSMYGVNIFVSCCSFQLDNVELPMDDSNKTLFYYIQKLILKLKSDKYKRVWDHTFMYVKLSTGVPVCIKNLNIKICVYLSPIHFVYPSLCLSYIV